MYKLIFIIDLVLVGLIVVLKIVQRVIASRRMKKRSNDALKGKEDLDATDVPRSTK